MAFASPSHLGQFTGIDSGLVHLHASGAWTYTPTGADDDSNDATDAWDAWNEGMLICVSA